MPVATPWQTVGPYFSIGLGWRCSGDLAPAGVAGERIAIAGRVLDGDGRGVDDALIEIWQADAEGRYRQPEDPPGAPIEGRFSGLGRVATDAAGGFRFVTVKPGRVAGPGGRLQAPHLVVSICMRGLLRRLVTRVYFAGEPGNADDPILKQVEPERRETLLARPTGADPACAEWNVVLQGDRETVFFDW